MIPYFVVTLVCIVLSLIFNVLFMFIPSLGVFIFAILVRQHIVRKYNIIDGGGPCNEFVTSFCCYTCSLAQSKRRFYFLAISFISTLTGWIFVWDVEENCSRQLLLLFSCQRDLQCIQNMMLLRWEIHAVLKLLIKPIYTDKVHYQYQAWSVRLRNMVLTYIASFAKLNSTEPHGR